MNRLMTGWKVTVGPGVTVNVGLGIKGSGL